MKIQSTAIVRCLVYGSLIVLALFFTFPALTGGSRGRSFDAQRKEQRQIIQNRVVAAGGWAAVQSGCEMLVSNSPSDYFFWAPPVTNAHVTEFSNSVIARRYMTNIDYGPLPPSLALLVPHVIEFDVATNRPTIVKMMLFGMHRTGGPDIPYYGLWVVCGETRRDYTPSITEGPGRVINKVADAVFEVH